MQLTSRYRPYLPLFWKFSIAITVVVIIFGSINYSLIRTNLTNTMRNELNRRLVFVSKTVSEHIVNCLLNNNYESIQRIINTAKANDSTIKFILLIDKDEQIISHSFQSEVPSAIINNYKCKDSCRYEVDYPMICFNPTLNVFQISKPIMNGDLGYLYIGFDIADFSANLDSSMHIFLVMIVTFFIIGIAGAFVFSYLITKPIQSLELLSSRMNLEKLTEKNQEIIENIANTNILLQRVLFRDEIDRLIDTYKEMLIRLSRTHKELQKLQTELIHSEKMSTIGVLAAGLAHDINNPITGVLNSINRIRKNLQNTEQTIKYLDLMEESAQKIYVVIKNLMNYARKDEIEFAPVELREVIDKSLLLVSHRLNEGNINVVRKYENKDYLISASRHHLEQVFINLLINSIDAIETKSNKFRNFDDKFIEIKIDKNDSVDVTITDNGIGIEEDKINIVTQTFYTTKKSEGTGLGLSIVQNILNLHNAKIEIQSQYEKWTIITIKFQQYEK